MTLKNACRLNQTEFIATTPSAVETNSLLPPLRLRGSALSQKFSHHSCRLDASELSVEPLKLERQPLMVEAQEVQNRCVQIADMHAVLRCVETEFIAFAQR